jgi:ribonuclease P protein component
VRLTDKASAPAAGADRPSPEQPSGPASKARLSKPPVITARADFLRAAQAARHGTAGFLLQARRRAPAEEATGYRLGITCSRKVGNAVARNRARRRLREVARLVLPEAGRNGWDYVLIGRADVTASRPFAAMQDDLRRALDRLHAASPPDPVSDPAAEPGPKALP